MVEERALLGLESLVRERRFRRELLFQAGAPDYGLQKNLLMSS